MLFNYDGYKLYETIISNWIGFFYAASDIIWKYLYLYVVHERKCFYMKIIIKKKKDFRRDCKFLWRRMTVKVHPRCIYIQEYNNILSSERKMVHAFWCTRIRKRNSKYLSFFNIKKTEVTKKKTISRVNFDDIFFVDYTKSTYRCVHIHHNIDMVSYSIKHNW